MKMFEPSEITMHVPTFPFSKIIWNVVRITLGVPHKEMKPKDDLCLHSKLVGDGVILRTAEQTKNLDARVNIPILIIPRPNFCVVADCSETKVVPQTEGPEKSQTIGGYLFLCESHQLKLCDLVSSRCAKEKIKLDYNSFNQNDFTGYTNMIGVFEQAYIYLKSKWWKGTNDILFAEIFLNTRNFLIITNTLLHPDDTATALGPYLAALSKVLEDRTKLKCGLELLLDVMGMILVVYGITYEWIHIPKKNPVAQIGAGMGILSVLFALMIGERIGFAF